MKCLCLNELAIERTMKNGIKSPLTLYFLSEIKRKAKEGTFKIDKKCTFFFKWINVHEDWTHSY